MILNPLFILRWKARESEVRGGQDGPASRFLALELKG
jgi:hypothetical protein